MNSVSLDPQLLELRYRPRRLGDRLASIASLLPARLVLTMCERSSALSVVSPDRSAVIQCDDVAVDKAGNASRRDPNQPVLPSLDDARTKREAQNS